MSPEIDAVIMKALAKSISDRYRSAVEFLEDLDRIQTGQTVVWEKNLTEDGGNELRTQVHKGCVIKCFRPAVKKRTIPCTKKGKEKKESPCRWPLL